MQPPLLPRSAPQGRLGWAGGRQEASRRHSQLTTESSAKAPLMFRLCVKIAPTGLLTPATNVRAPRSVRPPASVSASPPVPEKSMRPEGGALDLVLLFSLRSAPRGPRTYPQLGRPSRPKKIKKGTGRSADVVPAVVGDESERSVGRDGHADRAAAQHAAPLVSNASGRADGRVPEGPACRSEGCVLTRALSDTTAPIPIRRLGEKKTIQRTIRRATRSGRQEFTSTIPFSRGFDQGSTWFRPDEAIGDELRRNRRQLFGACRRQTPRGCIDFFLKI